LPSATAGNPAPVVAATADLAQQAAANLATADVDITQATAAASAGATQEVHQVSSKENSFGIHGELFYRDCYKVLIDLISIDSSEEFMAEKSRLLVEIRGSAGVGKSAFLAMCISGLKDEGLQDFAVFNAPKSHFCEKVHQIECSIWSNGELDKDKERMSIVDAQKLLVQQRAMRNLSYIFADGCAPPLNLEDFEGIVIATASPSISTKTLREQIMHPNIIDYVMPPWSLDEMTQAGAILDVDSSVIEDNFLHMNGIVRYAFAPDAARLKVDEAVKSVDATVISHLVATDNTDKQTKMNMVHALILWRTEKPRSEEDGKYNVKGNITYSLVSGYASKSVAQKLAASEMA
jgi:hypothetical protein